MNLTVQFERRSHDSSKLVSSNLTDCFVSLPNAVAASLWNLKPHASLIILSLRCKGNQISQAREQRSTIFVAWTGSTIPQPDALGIHPLFAFSIGLQEGQTVEVLAKARIVGNNPSVTVVSATLRPVSYKEIETREEDARNRNDPRSVARDHYDCLSETADILERTILPQIRVLYHGLRFPVSLPANDFIQVEVTQLKLSSNGPEEKYGVLVPGTELLIEPPPPEKGSQTDPVKVKERFRVISFSEALQSIPHNFLLTHAILPQQFSTSVHVRCARTSRRPLRDGDLLLPVAFVCRSTVPPKHVWLPPFIWCDLRLSPLDPVFIEEVPMFSQAPDYVQVATTNFVDSKLPSIDNICQARGIIYNGMRLRNGTLVIPSIPNTVAQRRTLSSKELSSGEENSVSEIMANWEGTDKWRSRLDDAFQTFRSHAKVISGWRIGEDQNITANNDKESFDVLGVVKTEERDSTFNPMDDDALRIRLAEGLTRLSRTAVHDAMKWARRTLAPMEDSDESNISNILLISGPEGSGKTLVCKTIAAILRGVGLLRTIWIQCTDKKEKSGDLLKRIQRAYDAAADGGRGMVILDDMDFWIGSRHSEEDRLEDLKEETGKDAHASEMLRRMRMTRRHPVLSIITCRNAMELDSSFRAPGVIGKRIALELPGREDMSILGWSASREMKSQYDMGFGSPDSDSESALGRVTASLEGYNAKEVQLLFSRAFSQVDVDSTIPRNQQVVQQLQKMISEMAPGRMKKGSRFRNKEASWTWKKIGGAETAKKSLTEVLLWPSKRHDLFESAPLSLPRGVLLYGPPGCGKTLLAKAAANESKMRCIVVKGPELMSKYIGESEAEVRRVFARASRLRPCVLLFDEFDALAPRRGSGTGVTDRIVNTLLTCMDGAERLSEGVYLLATSSRPELIDPAVLRPGRIDRWVPVEAPASAEERYDILKRLSVDLFKSSEPLDNALRNVAHVTEEYSGADLGAILNDARIKIRKKGLNKKPGEDEVVEAIGEALKESHPSLSHAERARFREVMESFGRTPGKRGKAVLPTQRVALK